MSAFHSSNSLILVTLPSGGQALYEVQPQHLNLQHRFVGPAASEPPSLRDIAMQLGEQLAHEMGGVWYRRGGWEPIADFRLPVGVARA